MAPKCGSLPRDAGDLVGLLLASSLAAGRRSAPRDRYDRHLLLFVHSLLNRCYILVSGSVRVRVRVRARVSARVAVKDRDRN